MLKKMKTFVVVAEAGSFTKAAHLLYVSQPAVSQQIAQLEAELNVALFIRSGKALRLTSAGEMLYKGIQAPIASVERVLNDVSSVKEQTPSLTIRYHNPSDEFLVFEIMQLAQAAPLRFRVKLERMTRSPQTLLDLSNGQADLAFCRRAEIPAGLDTSFQPLFCTYLTAALPQGHKLSSKKNVEIEEFFDGPVVVLSNRDRSSLVHEARGYLRRQDVHDLIAKSHVNPSLISYADDTFTVLIMVKAKYGITCVDTLKTTHEQNICFVPMRQNNLQEYGLAYRASDESPECAFAREGLKNRCAGKLLCPGGQLMDAQAFLRQHDIELTQS